MRTAEGGVRPSTSSEISRPKHFRKQPSSAASVKLTFVESTVKRQALV